MKKILICSGSHCRNNFSEDVVKVAEDHIENSHNDEFIVVEKTRCMNFCEIGSNVCIENKLYHGMTTTKMKEKLAEKFPGKFKNIPKQRNADFGLESVSKLLQL